MTPVKEKAKELVEKFTFKCKECDYDWNAKQCALIAVAETLEALELNTWQNQKQIEYYLEVQKEIEKL